MDLIHTSSNQLLMSLPQAAFELLRPHLQMFEMAQEVVLVAAGQPVTQVFFPNSGVISLVVSLETGEMIEVAMIGRDSVFGAAAALDGRISLTDAIVQLPGEALTLEVSLLRSIADGNASFRTMLTRHEQALFAQAQQSAACNASHTVEARLARWLLRTRDLTGSDHLPLTQEFLAQMIGVQRNSVSSVAHELQKRGFIRYNRGHIEIIYPAGLRSLSCECYLAVKTQYERLLN